jgi:hypothetical protein
MFREDKVRRPRQEFSSLDERRSPLQWCRRRREFRDLDSGTKTKKKNEESVDVFTNSVKNEEQTFSLCTFSHYSVNTLFAVRVRSCRQEISVVFLLFVFVAVFFWILIQVRRRRKKEIGRKQDEEGNGERKTGAPEVCTFFSQCMLFLWRRV